MFANSPFLNDYALSNCLWDGFDGFEFLLGREEFLRNNYTGIAETPIL